MGLGCIKRNNYYRKIARIEAWYDLVTCWGHTRLKVKINLEANNQRDAPAVQSVSAGIIVLRGPNEVGDVSDVWRVEVVAMEEPTEKTAFQRGGCAIASEWPARLLAEK